MYIIILLIWMISGYFILQSYYEDEVFINCTSNIRAFIASCIIYLTGPIIFITTLIDIIVVLILDYEEDG